MNIFYEYIILLPAISFLVTILIKGIYIRLKTGKADISGALGSGGMPSAHSSVVVSMTVGLALKFGLKSEIFALAITFAFIVLYDAVNVRYEAGEHAKYLNDSIGEEKFKQPLGHLPSEMFVGSILGSIIAIVLYVI